jgi:hypothetical protein
VAKGILIALTFAIASLGVLAPVAAADDQSVYDVWVSRDSGFAQAGRTFTRAMAHQPPRTAPALRALRKGLRLIKVVVGAINAQTPSSDAGNRGKSAALESMNLFRLSLVHKRRAVAALAEHHRRLANRELKRGSSLTKRSLQVQNTARQAFKEAGVQVKPR